MEKPAIFYLRGMIVLMHNRYMAINFKKENAPMLARQTIVRAVCALAIAFLAFRSLADNGIIVTVHCKSKAMANVVGTRLCGSIVKYPLNGTSVGTPVTIFDYPQGGLAHYPVISLDGQHVVFWRWGVSQTRSGDNLSWVLRPGSLPNPNYLPDTNWLSVMNIDGTGLRNLLMVDIPTVTAWEELISAIAWPSGDWIYYEKPTNSWEIWRVNYKNPLLNELVVKFVRDPAQTDAQSLEYAPYFRRFSMSADARFAAGQLGWYTNTSFFNFPPPGGDVMDPAAHLQGTGGCNTAMSASGTRIAHYLSGNHDVTYFKTYNGIIGQDDGSQNIQGGSEMIRWAANSDRWLTQVYSSGLADDGYQNFSNQVVRDVANRQSIYPENNSNGWNNDAGQVWISGAPNPESYMDRNGNWVAVPPVVPRDLTAPTTPGNLQATAQGAHVSRLTWSASTDAESGVFCYIIYRGGVQVGTSQTLAYADSGLSENTAYAYTVSAINRGNTESTKASVSITTPIDAQGATIISVDAANGATSLIVSFDEPLDQATAQTAGNYTLSGGTVTGAVLSADGKKVTLTTGAMTAGTAYTLTLHNVLDKAATPNASIATASFTYQGLAHGLVYETYNASCGYDDVPAMTGTPAKTGVVRNFDLSNLGSSCAARFKGYLKVPAAGRYEFKFTLYYAGNAYIDGAKVISAPGNYEGARKMTTLNLSTSPHSLQVDMATPYPTMWLLGWYVGPDGIQHRISDDMLYHSANGAPVDAGHYAASPIGQGLVAFRQTASNLDVRIGEPGRYALTIVSSNGATIRSLEGAHPARIRVPIADLASGIYFVKIDMHGKTIVRPLTLP